MMFFLVKKSAQNQPIIPVSHELNEPIVEWTDNKSLMIGAFPDKFIFGQGVPNGLPTQQNWKLFSLYYDGRFDDPLFIAHGSINCSMRVAFVTRLESPAKN
jgi:hypothetical protein